MREVQITKALVATVDDADYENVSGIRWYAIEAGNDSKTFYAISDFENGDGKRIFVSMQDMILGSPEGLIVDHIDRNGLHNRRINLRHATKSQNMMNAIKRVRATSSQYKGVWFARWANRWRAGIKLDGKKIHLGYFNNEADAAMAYNQAAIIYFGVFARLNVVRS